MNIVLNDDTILDLEMQMANEGNWTDRALSYACRNFTHIQKGLDKWVALFKSKTWKGLKMIANEKPELLAASESL